MSAVAEYSYLSRTMCVRQGDIVPVVDHPDAEVIGTLANGHVIARTVGSDECFILTDVAYRLAGA